MNTAKNQRFKDTEILMQSAMLKLMEETEFKKITVKKICEEAHVNRSTFYAHFIDIYDMLDKMEATLRKELLSTYQHPSDESYIFSKHSFLIFLDHIKKHKYFYRINLQTRKNFPLKQGYEDLWKLIENRCKAGGIDDKEEILYYLINFQAGLTITLKHWVDTDCKASKEKIAEIIRNGIPNILMK